MPMYYRYDEGEAYELGNQYIFGGQLLVSPITKPADKRLNLAPARVWLPKGRWTDIFNSRIYEGDMMVDMYRDIDSIPVLAPEGAIIPMYRSDRTNDLSREQPLEIHIWRGNGHYELYEDDGETVAYRDGKFAITTFDLTEDGGRITLTITPPRESDVLPESREMYIKFRDILTDEIKLTVGREPITVELSDYKVMENPDEGEMRSALLTRVQGSNDKKSRTFKKKLPKYLEGALAEISALKR
jgi:alpha-glucosidase (family GH31 glycosyl hydrolase)